MVLKSIRSVTALFMAVAVLAGCSTNPVSGEREVSFYDVDWERQTGEKMYVAMRQSQGGDYVVDPELSAYVQEIGDSLAVHARRANELDFEFNVLNDSSPNAWALPGGKIAINRGLLAELESEAELAAVLGHEIVHADAAHTAAQQSKGTLIQAGAIAASILLGTQADSTAGKTAGLVLPQVGAQLLSQKYSRDAETESDYYGMIYMSEAGYDPQGAVELQETFVKLAEGRDPDWVSGLFASHPPSRDRVERNRKTAADLPAGGRVGRDEFQRRTAHLKNTTEAYDAYGDALGAASEGEYGKAESLVGKAISIEPRESLFYALRGDLAMVDENESNALNDYNRAVSLNPNLYYPKLQRGSVYASQGKASQARSDLQGSIALLPTAQAHYFLGNIERDAGNRSVAREHYSKAAQSDSNYGRAARSELQKLGQ